MLLVTKHLNMIESIMAYIVNLKIKHIYWIVLNFIHIYFSGEDESSDESEAEMEVDGAAPYSTTSGAKHDLMLKQEVRNLKSDTKLFNNLCSCSNRR